MSRHVSIKFAMCIVIARLNWTDSKCFVNKQTMRFPQLVFFIQLGYFRVTRIQVHLQYLP